MEAWFVLWWITYSAIWVNLVMGYMLTQQLIWKYSIRPLSSR
jgi:hypothetical protein